MAITVIAPLGNINCPMPSALSQNATIEAFPDHLREVVQVARENYIIRHPVLYKNSADRHFESTSDSQVNLRSGAMVEA